MQKVILALLCMFFLFSEANSENKDLHPALKALDIKTNVLSRKGTTGQLSVNIEITNTGDEQIIIINGGLASSFFTDLYIAVYDHSDILFYEVDYDPFVNKYHALNKNDSYRNSFPIFTEYKGMERVNLLSKCKKIVVKVFFYAASETAKIKKGSGLSNLIEKTFTIDPICHSSEIAPYRDYIPKN